MRAVWSGLVALAVSLVASGSARAKDYVGPPSSKTVVVDLDKSGIVPLDLKLGKVHFHQLIVRNAPTDPEQVAALKPGSSVSPRPFLVVTDRGTYEVELKVATRFLDGAGAEVFACEQRGVNVDEDTFLRVEPACGRLAFTSIPVAQWARVEAVELAITVQEQHN